MKLNIRLAVACAVALATSWAVQTQEKKDDAATGLLLEKADTIEFTTDQGT